MGYATRKKHRNGGLSPWGPTPRISHETPRGIKNARFPPQAARSAGVLKNQLRACVNRTAQCNPRGQGELDEQFLNIALQMSQTFKD
jgi:hypothetical protein